MDDFNFWDNSPKKKKSKSDNFSILGIPSTNIKSKKNNIFGIEPLNLNPIKEKSEIKYERVPVGNSQKQDILFKQKGKCAKCGVNFHEEGLRPYFDHIKRVESGGASKLINLQALCSNCHDKKTHKENVKKIEKTRKTPKKKENNDFNNLLYGGLAPKKSSKNKNPFDFKF